MWFIRASSKYPVVASFVASAFWLSRRDDVPRRACLAKGLNTLGDVRLIGEPMKNKTAFSLLAVASLALSSAAFSAGTKDYQVTGPIVEITDSMIAVEKTKGKDERWVIARDANTKVPG